MASSKECLRQMQRDGYVVLAEAFEKTSRQVPENDLTENSADGLLFVLKIYPVFIFRYFHKKIIFFVFT